MKWVVVTGDSVGLGKEIVERVLECTKYSVIGISRTGRGSVSDFKSRYGQRFVHIDFDLERSEDVKALYLEKIKGLGSIVGLVNNAATAYDDIVTNAQVAPLERMFRINFHTSVMLTKYAIRDMLLNEVEGSIVHVSSVCAHTGYKGLSMYAASKGALEAFSKSTAREWGARGIRSNCVAPGFMETEMSESLTKDQKDRIYKRTSLKRPTDAKSVAEAVVYLLSDGAKSITGEVLHIDCGTI